MVIIDIQQVESYVKDLFKEKIPKHLSYHNLDHTLYVVEQARLIGNESKLSEEEIEILVAAAWFHDSGFAVSTDEHELEGQKIASEFLSSRKVNENAVNAFYFSPPALCIFIFIACTNTILYTDSPEIT